MKNSCQFGIILGKRGINITTEIDVLSSINDIFSGKLFIRIHTTLFC